MRRARAVLLPKSSDRAPPFGTAQFAKRPSLPNDHRKQKGQTERVMRFLVCQANNIINFFSRSLSCSPVFLTRRARLDRYPIIYPPTSFRTHWTVGKLFGGVTHRQLRQTSDSTLASLHIVQVACLAAESLNTHTSSKGKEESWNLFEKRYPGLSLEENHNVNLA